jgi:tetraacyldisaccharide 4'-kinase
MLRLLLRPAEAVYAAATRCRASLYAAGRLRTRVLTRPVISVGNISLGGAGKTPFAAALARAALARGLKPAILSRGYRRRSTGTLVVSDGSGPRVDGERAGDEALLLAREVPGVAVVVASRRYDAGVIAERQLGAELHILDDGFQHLALERRLNLLLLDVTRNPAGQRVLPLGRLREPVSAIGRADLVVLTRTHLGRETEPVRNWLQSRHPDIPVVDAAQRVIGLRGPDGGSEPIEAWRGRPILALASIGNPDAFVADLEGLGMRVAARLHYRDHHRYTPGDVRQVASLLRGCGAEAVVTTLKDMVHLEKLARPALRLLGLEIETLLPVHSAFGERLESVFQEAETGR